ncbi:MAG: hypothetical protein KF709_14755 [Gemmatimonadaceae bacterium]|nr:hypothetical protein [Gemmatimonadaceae bacterium]
MTRTSAFRLARGACVAALAMAAGAVPGALQAQDNRPCEIVITGVVRGADTTRLYSVTTPSGGRDTYVGGIVDATCEGQGNRLLADSAEHFAQRGLLILYHNVRYTEPRVTITSDKMFYYTREERIVAEGNVKGRTATGTRFEGPMMDYYRAKPGMRVHPYWTATGRPFVRMSPEETGAAPGTSADSVDLTANRVYSYNDSVVYASGRVVIERSDLRATSDSAYLDNGREFARLLREPVVVGKGERSFTLVGVEIDMYSRDRKIERVLSGGEAKVTSDSLVLTADTLDMRLKEQQMERVYAWGGRALADGADQDIEADSMDILMPGQRLERLHAVGRALALSDVDTTNIITDERDWITGDTLIAHFESVTDSLTAAARTLMRQVVALGSARAFYQMAPSGGVRGKPNLSYNRGRQISVDFTDGEMARVQVSADASGLFLEPLAPTPQDSTRGARRPAARPDTTASPREKRP